jgi:hypothetical protein
MERTAQQHRRVLAGAAQVRDGRVRSRRGSSSGDHARHIAIVIVIARGRRLRRF